MEHECPACGVERTDYVGPGDHLPNCPNCGVPDVPVPYDATAEPAPDVSKFIDDLCEHRIGGGEVRDDSFRRDVRIALMRLIDQRIAHHLAGLTIDDLT